MKGRSSSVGLSLPKPTSTVRCWGSISLSTARVKYFGQNAKRDLRNQLKTIQRAGRWWWRRHLLMFRMTPSATYQSMVSLNYQHALSPPRIEGGAALLTRHSKSTARKHLQYDVTVCSCSTFGKDVALLFDKEAGQVSCTEQQRRWLHSTVFPAKNRGM